MGHFCNAPAYQSAVAGYTRLWAGSTTQVCCPPSRWSFFSAGWTALPEAAHRWGKAVSCAESARSAWAPWWCFAVKIAGKSKRIMGWKAGVEPRNLLLLPNECSKWVLGNGSRGCHAKEMRITVSQNEGPRALALPIKLNQLHSRYCTTAQSSVDSVI